MSFKKQAATLSQDEVAALLADRHNLIQDKRQSLKTVDRLTQSNQSLTQEIDSLKLQLGWFKNQLFGNKSERRILPPDSRQLTLGEWIEPPEIEKETPVQGHKRKTYKPKADEAKHPTLRFDESVPVERIYIKGPKLEEGDEIIAQKITHRLAQRPSSYLIMEYIRDVVKKKADGKITSAPAPASVLGKSIADVSLLSCLAIDKFCYHLPLYRQHQRMKASGLTLSRSTLTGWMQRTADLLQPIYHAQVESILSSDVLAADETPIKAGRKADKKKMKTGYFWPLYGDKHEVVFPYSQTRATKFIREALSDYQGVLLSDGYQAYEKYAEKADTVVHAQCWAHARRKFIKAETVEPKLVTEALRQIRELYKEEREIRERKLDGTKKAEYRVHHCKPIVDEFFAWLNEIVENHILLPKSPLTIAANYALAREGPLRVFLSDPNVPVNTNHLERQIRPIALGRKNWMFCWTELGAFDVGVFQSLLTTCRLHEVDPYTYLVDVLQRVQTHPAKDVAQLTPRLWKEHFAEEPMRSELDLISQ